MIGECRRELIQVVWPARPKAWRALRVSLGTAAIVTVFVAALNIGLEHGVASLIR